MKFEGYLPNSQLSHKTSKSRAQANCSQKTPLAHSQFAIQREANQPECSNTLAHIID